MGNQPDKITWSEEEFNDHNKYLYDLEDDPNYQSAVVTYDSRLIALNWLLNRTDDVHINMRDIILAVYIMDAYLYVVGTDNYSVAMPASLFLARNCTNVETIELDDFVGYIRTEDQDKVAGTVGDIMEKLGGRIIRPIPSFFIYNVSELQNNLIFIALLRIKNAAQFKPSVIAKSIKYMTSDDLDYNELSDEANVICYELSNELLKIKKDGGLTEKIGNIVDNIFLDENFKRRCSDFVEIKLNIKRNTKIESLPVFRTPYKESGVLGKGISGEVHKISKRGKDMAVKFQDEGYYEEVSVLAVLSKSKYIIKLEGFLPEKAMVNESFLFFEIGNYELKTAIVKHDYPEKSEKELLMYFKDILEGLKACEYYDVIHADIKPDNVLWFEKEKRYKLIDFGLAMSMSSQRDELRVEVCTAMFRPPEVFLSNGTYDYKIDIWSAGCVLYHMVTGRYYVDYTKLLIQSDMFKFVFRDQGIPTEETWPGVTKLPNYKNYEDLSFPPNPNFLREIPDNKNMCYAVIKSCLTMNPKNRPNAETLLGCLKKY